MNPTITLISDWRLRDPYLAIFKSQLYTTFPEVHVLDITHHVDLFNISQTAFLMKNSYKHFPEGSIHLILTNTSFTSNTLPVVLSFDGHYFIGEDSGIFFMMFGKNNKLQGRQAKANPDTRVLDKMIELAQAILQNKLDAVSTEYNDFKRALAAEPINIIPERTIEGEIVFIDAACNAITNIPTQMLIDATQGNAFTAYVQSKTEWKIQKFHEHYKKEEGIFFTTNALNHLEITMFQGDIAILASMNVGDKVTINY